MKKGKLQPVLTRHLKKIKKTIANLSNKEICSTDLDELESYYVNKNLLEEIELFKDNVTKELSETKIKEYNHFYRRGYDEYEPQFYSIDGYKTTFTIPFDGDENLLYLRPSTFYMNKFPIDTLISPTDSEYGKILISFDFKKKELLENENSNELVKKDSIKK